MFRAFVSLSSLFGGVEVLKLERCLPAEPYAESGPKLLTRETTRTAWKAIFQVIEKEKRVAMLGIPGIGKSRSLALGLVSCWQRAPRVGSRLGSAQGHRVGG